MLFTQILVRTLALAVTALTLAACGQTGALYLPTPPAGTQRATLPESLMPQVLTRLSVTPAVATAPVKASSQASP